jgi:hypothetical protein
MRFSLLVDNYPNPRFPNTFSRNSRQLGAPIEFSPWESYFAAAQTQIGPIQNESRHNPWILQNVRNSPSFERLIARFDNFQFEATLRLKMCEELRSKRKAFARSNKFLIARKCNNLAFEFEFQKLVKKEEFFVLAKHAYHWERDVERSDKLRSSDPDLKDRKFCKTLLESDRYRMHLKMINACWLK